MKCVVTGGAGFIGSHVVDLLIKEGHKVVVFDDLTTGREENLNKKAKFYKRDVAVSIKKFQDKCRGADVIFHLAAWARVPRSIEDPIGTNRVNVQGTLNMLQIARNMKIKRFVYSSSSSVYGKKGNPVRKENMELEPLSPYALQKKIGEEYCKMFTTLFDMEAVALRYFNVYGPRQLTKGAYSLVVGKFLDQKKKGEPMPIFGDGKQTRSYTYVSDVARANLLAATKKIPNKFEAFNIGTRVETSVNEIADMIGGKKKIITPHPWGKYEERRKAANFSKASKILGWKPLVDIETGIDIVRNE